MASTNDDTMKRLETATRGVRLALDVLNEEIQEMQDLSDTMANAIAKMYRASDGEVFGIPQGIKPLAIEAENLEKIA